MKTLIPGLLAALLLTAVRCADAGPYDGLYVFGDSLSDVGRVFALTGGLVPPSSKYFDGRFSNGHVAAEDLGALLGLPVTTANDYAYGGATTGFNNLAPAIDQLEKRQNPSASGTGLLSQIQMFQGGHAAADPNALYMIWAGANDFGNPAAITAATPVAAVQNVTQAIQDLESAGARHFLIPDLPDLGATPAAGADSAGLGAVSRIFNYGLPGSGFGGLQGAVGALDAAGADIRFVDVFALEQRVLANPAAFGFSNVTDPLSANPGATGHYLYWDDEHPTAYAHGLLSLAFFAAVEPSSAAAVPEAPKRAMLAGGLMALALKRAWRRRLSTA